MKFFNLCFVLCLFLISCSNNEESIQAATTTASHYSSSQTDTYRIDSFEVSNPHNPFDIVGALHVELYKAYYAMDSLSTKNMTVKERVLLVTQQNDMFSTLSSQPYILNDLVLNTLVEQVSCCSGEVIRDSFLTAEGSTTMQTLLGSLLPYCSTEENFGAIFETLVSYENTVLESQLPLPDKQILLSAAAVVRHVSYERKKRPKKNTDPDWDMMVWSIAGSAAGSMHGVEDAIFYSVVCGVSE